MVRIVSTNARGQYIVNTLFENRAFSSLNKEYVFTLFSNFWKDVIVAVIKEICNHVFFLSIPAFSQIYVVRKICTLM